MCHYKSNYAMYKKTIKDYLYLLMSTYRIIKKIIL